MKYYITFLSAIFFASICFGQQIEFANMASITPPGRMQKMQHSEVLNITHQKLGKHPSLQSFINDHPDNMYKVDNILVLVKTVPKSPSFKLETQRKLFQRSGSTSIETLGGKKFLITFDTTLNDIAVYHFFCVNSSNTTQVGGLVTADIKDKEKAKAVIYDIVKGIKFKVQ
ncbi:hypothetical protein [Mucilaginibacter panaciglaebae]|uniref:Uncharacterized protein n=1 Tax=Mucilaginibacter panaciglaebae TaxID=502331 RepID=A0ABP7X598_9SPHI